VSEILTFKIRSGGAVAIALERCVDCPTRACLSVCRVQGGPLELNEERGVPGLNMSLFEIERGGCVECLGCEQECALHGRQAVTITLPLPHLDEYLEALTEPVVYKDGR
jgi:formate hydrogenlyase subunit 6/NADH:ubiquinone oxidoreductase subunit I